jgi:Ca-activated chloride channel homolog
MWKNPAMKTRILGLLTALLAMLGFAHGDGLIIIHNPPNRIPGHFSFAPLEVVFHNVEVDIVGQRATTRVAQEFFNPNAANLEGDYIFPIPKGAHLDKFTMRIGDKEMEAELLDAGKARAIYEDIVRRQKDPALLEYTGRPAFRVRIFPFEGRSRKKITLEYTELLKVDGGLASYVYPLNTEKFSSQPLKNVGVRVKVAAESPLKALYSPSHPVEIKRDGNKRATVDWEARNVRPDTDFQLLFSSAETEVGLHLLTHKKPGEDGWFLLLGSPGADMTKTRVANPKDVVFVMDTSGSMAGKKLEQAKKAMMFCVENLNDGDRFELVRFSTEAEPLFEKLTAASRENRDQALEFIKGLKPIGGTAIAEALDTALKLNPADGTRPFVVVFLTDGKPTIGETDEERIIARVADGKAGSARIFCFGIGTDINSHLLDKVAERTRAATQFVLPEEDLEVKVSSFFMKIREPLLTNLRLEFPPGVRITKLYPNPLPDLFRGEQLVLTGRYSGDSDGDIALEGMLNGVPKRMSQAARFSGDTGNEFIAQLWALRRVGWLLDEIRLRGESKELRDEVVDLARRFAIVTPYTSYLIVEDEARRGVPIGARSLPLLDRDPVAQGYFKRNWEQMVSGKDGYNGTLAGRGNTALKSAESAPVALEKAKQENLGGVIANNLSGSDASSAGAVAAKPSAPLYSDKRAKTVGATGNALDIANRATDTEQHARWIRGKTFTQTGALWADTALQSAANFKRNRIQFASNEYFDLLKREPDSAEWLALGGNVSFAMKGEIYEVFE